MKKFLFVISLTLCMGTKMLAADSTHTLLFISDTQAPMIIETIRVPATNNEEATQMLYSSIARQTTVDAVYHLGDITSIGMFDWYWSSFDAFHASLRVPLYAVPGNHDYYYFTSLAMRQFKHRFPEQPSTWFTKRFGDIAVVALNSNFSKLSDHANQRQRSWYTGELAALDRDSTVKAIIVVCHHPPFTNSMIVGPSEDVQEEFVKPFMAYGKCRVFLSGHAHVYEHFRKEGKDFLVIGGAGGLMHPLKTANERVFADIAVVPESARFFHYLECSETADGLRFSVHMMRRDMSGFDILDPFTVAFGR
jgi:predicted phosphodiesterase